MLVSLLKERRLLLQGGKNMKNELKVLKPVDVSKEELAKIYRKVKEVSENFPRVGGGVFQINAIETSDGWIIQCAFVKRDILNHKNLPLPDGGLFDIEATKDLENVVCNNREIQICGSLSEPNPFIIKAISERNVGFVTRERRGKENDFSIETVMALYTPGIWKSAKDIQYNRQIVYVEISPKGDVGFCNFESNKFSNMTKLPMEICTEKVLLAISVAKDICKVLNIK